MLHYEYLAATCKCLLAYLWTKYIIDDSDLSVRLSDVNILVNLCV